MRVKERKERGKERTREKKPCIKNRNHPFVLYFLTFFFPYYSLIASHLNSYYQAWVENVQGSALLAAARTPDASYLDEEGSDDVRMGKRNSLSLSLSVFFFFPWFYMYNYIFHHFTRFVPLIL